jgi:hypothetical protein
LRRYEIIVEIIISQEIEFLKRKAAGEEEGLPARGVRGPGFHDSSSNAGNTYSVSLGSARL